MKLKSILVLAGLNIVTASVNSKWTSAFADSRRISAIRRVVHAVKINRPIATQANANSQSSTSAAPALSVGRTASGLPVILVSAPSPVQTAQPVQPAQPVQTVRAVANTPNPLGAHATETVAVETAKVCSGNVVFADVNDQEGCQNATRQYTGDGSAVVCFRGGGCSMDGHVPDATHKSANPNSIGACITKCGKQDETGVEKLLSNLYGSFLKRAPDEVGKAGFLKMYNTNPNMTCGEIAYNLSLSEEFRLNTVSLSDFDYVLLLYQGFLRRPHDINGLAANLNQLNTLTATNGSAVARLQMAAAFTGSAEMTQQCKSLGLWP